MSVLSNYLKKLKIEDYSKLSESEKETYTRWQEVLSGKKLTDEDIEMFLNKEENDTINKLIEKTLSERDDIFLKMKLDFVRKIKGFLASPALEKRVLEQNIKNLL